MSFGTVGKRISLVFAWLCGLGALAGIGGTGYAISEMGWEHPISASLLATVVFLVSCAAVLYVMSRPPEYPPRS